MTGLEIEQYTQRLIVENNLLSIGGGCYIGDERPFNSKQEDCNVRLLTGNAAQVQEGNVIVNIFVPDVMAADGLWYRNTERCSEVEQMLEALPAALSRLGDVRYTHDGMIATYMENQIRQHFVSAKLKFKLLKGE